MYIYDFGPYYIFDGPLGSSDNLEDAIEQAKVMFENHKGPYVVCVCNKNYEVEFYLEKKEK